MAITVTATQGGSTANGLGLRVYVLTGAAAVAGQTGATAQNSSNSAAISVNITTTGHPVYGAITAGSTGIWTADSGTTFPDQFHDSTNAETYGTCKATPASGVSTPVGSSNNVGGGIAIMEILPNGTIAEDASGPAYVSTTSALTVTTASFTPPAGSLLVALVGSDGGASTTTMTVSGGSLTWTEKIKANVAGNDYAGVWIASVPAASGNVLPYQTIPSVIPRLVRANYW